MEVKQLALAVNIFSDTVHLYRHFGVSLEDV